jgi:hypothetical protein
MNTPQTWTATYIRAFRGSLSRRWCVLIQETALCSCSEMESRRSSSWEEGEGERCRMDSLQVTSLDTAAAKLAHDRRIGWLTMCLIKIVQWPELLVFIILLRR